MAEKVLTERRGRTFVVAINRPEVRNCVDGDTAALLFEGVEEFKRDEGLDVLILTGAGTEAFCSGADLKNIGSLGARAGARDSARWASRASRTCRSR
jgi:enoyl-CoA hydratase/carnithine racemase